MPRTPTLKTLTILGATIVVLLVDWFFLVYFTSYGFEEKIEQITIGNLNVAVPIQWLPVLGVVIVSIVLWYEVSAQLFPRIGSVEADPLTKVRLLRTVALSLAFFVWVLFVPYLVGSTWFWTRLGEASMSVSQIRDFGQSLLNLSESVMALNKLWGYSLSQVLATGVMVLTAFALGRAPRRPRKQR